MKNAGVLNAEDRFWRLPVSYYITVILPQSQNGWGKKAALGIVLSKNPAQAGSARADCEGLHKVGG